MTRFRRFFAGQGVTCLGLAIFTVCVLVVFFPALPKFMALESPDAGPYFMSTHRADAVEGVLTGGAFTPQMFYWLLFNPLYAHELTYIIDSLVLALAGVYYLTTRRVHPLAAWAGGLALGLSGYTFTLFCAGHRGYFHMFSSAVWAFGLLSRCFETRKLFYFAMLGLVIAWGATYQPDVMVMVGVVAAAYALWLTATSRVGAGDWSQKGVLGRVFGTLVSVWPRFSVSLLVLVLAGFGSLRSAVTTQMTNRDAQIAGVSPQEFGTEKRAVVQSEAEKHNRWIFATNWSLPPEDMLEFIAPGVFGDESMQRPYPYWGRLGRPSDEVFQKGRMMPNYRGHTVYLGLVSVIFALFGVVMWFAQRRGIKASPPAQVTADHSDIPFWCAVWAVCLLLAMGRYTPLYRLFYSIPYMDYIRAPVKFHHLVELSSAFLAGFGFDAFIRSAAGPSGLRRKLAVLAGGVAVALALGAGLMLANKASIVAHIGSLGIGQAAEALSGYAVQNLMRSACLAALVAGLAYASCKVGERALVRLGGILLAVLALEQACVASRFVRVVDVERCYRENAVVKAIKKAADGRVVNVVNYVTQKVLPQEWFSMSLALNGINNLAPTADEKDAPIGKLFAALRNDPVRLWRLFHVQYVMVPRKGCEPLLRAGVLTPVLDFELGAGGVRQVQPGDATFMLARVRDAVPLPRFLAGWQGGVPADKQVEAVISGPRDVSDVPSPVAERGQVEAGEVRVLASRGLPGTLATRAAVKATLPGLLIFNERLTGGLEALVDGRPVALSVADAIWQAVPVAAGEHVVTLRKQRKVMPFVLSGATSAALLFWGLFARVARRSVPAGRTTV